MTRQEWIERRMRQLCAEMTLLAEGSVASIGREGSKTGAGSRPPRGPNETVSEHWWRCFTLTPIREREPVMWQAEMALEVARTGAPPPMTKEDRDARILSEIYRGVRAEVVAVKEQLSARQIERIRRQNDRRPSDGEPQPKKDRQAA